MMVCSVVMVAQTDLGDLACIEIETYGEVGYIAVTTNYLQETLDALAAQGITAVEVDCDDADLDIPDLDDFPFDDFDDYDDYYGGYDDYDFDFDSLGFGDLACIEVEVDGELSYLTIPTSFLQATLDALADEGIAAVEVNCDDVDIDFDFDIFGGLDCDSLDFDFGDYDYD